MSELGDLLRGAGRSSSQYNHLAKKCEDLRQEANCMLAGLRDIIGTKLRERLEDQFPIFERITFLGLEVRALQAGIVMCQLSYYGWFHPEEQSVWDKGQMKFIRDSRREIAKILDIGMPRVDVHVSIRKKHPDD